MGTAAGLCFAGCDAFGANTLSHDIFLLSCPFKVVRTNQDYDDVVERIDSHGERDKGSKGSWFHCTTLRLSAYLPVVTEDSTGHNLILGSEYSCIDICVLTELLAIRQTRSGVGLSICSLSSNISIIWH
jgi:hypothetical protein